MNKVQRDGVRMLGHNFSSFEMRRFDKRVDQLILGTYKVGVSAIHCVGRGRRLPMSGVRMPMTHFALVRSASYQPWRIREFAARADIVTRNGHGYDKSI
ncbi:unnamed protein product [Pieris brassicae]|uniref:Uncharacterized protein n=1 Tax=Pieris brassicae TaxID=7116 RepID=A0A9P0SR36_PIEBR|nr:unnamed protein product [Pieris brassicae]